MQPIQFKVNLDAASATKVAAAQTALINANLVLTSAATSGIDSSGAARILLLTTTENDSAGNAVITGTDADGNTITETIAWPNIATKATTNAYATVTSIKTTIAITANVSVGTVNTTLSALSKTIPLNFYARTGAVVATKVTGTIVYTVQETFDPILSTATSLATFYNGSLSNDTQNTSGAGTVGANLLSLSSVNGISTLDRQATGMRISIASYATGATLTVNVVQTDASITS